MSEPLLTEKISYTAGGMPEYIGQAIPGSGGGADPIWRIKRLVYDGANVTESAWANGELTYNKVWTLRGTYAYS